jgi:ligand-binding sensor domain-containing protein
MRLKPLARYIVLLYLCFCGIASSGQQLSYRHFGVNEGLPHPELYALCKGANNTLWISTDNGLSNYDGSSFKNYSTKNATGSSFVLSATELPDQRLLVNAYRGGLCFWENGEMIKASVSQAAGFYYSYSSMEQLLKTLFTVQYDSLNHCVWAILSGYALAQLTIKGRHITVERFWNNMPYYHVYIDTANQTTWIASNNGLLQFKNGDIQPSVAALRGKEVTKIAAFGSGALLLAGPQGLMLYNIRKGLVEDEAIFAGQPIQYKDFLYDAANGLYWIPDLNGGVRVYEANKPHRQRYHLLQDANVNYLFADGLGNVWCCTYGSGLFQFPQAHIVNYNVADGLRDNYVTHIKSVGNKINIACLRSFYAFDTLAGTFRPLLLTNLRKPHNKVIVKPDGKPLFTTGSSILDDSQRTIWDGKKLIYDAAYLAKDTLLVANYGGFSVLNKAFQTIKHNYQLPKYLSYHKILSLKDTLLLASNNGVYMRFGSIWQHANEANGLPDNFVYDVKVHDGKVYCATRSGLAMIDREGYIGYDAARPPGNTLILGLCKDGRGGMWMATGNGLYLEYKGMIYLFDVRDGLVANDLTEVYREGDRLYVGTTQGLSIIQLPAMYQVLEQQRHCQLTVQAWASNGNRNSAIYDGVSLAAAENDVWLKVVGPDFSMPGLRQLEYSIDGGKSWTAIDGRRLALRSLGYGNYRMQVRTKLRNQQQYQLLADYAFSIRVPWYRNVFFIIGLVLLLMLVAGWLFFRYSRRKHQRAVQQLQVQQQVLDLKQKAMAALLNPHFVFNSINSINYYIHNGEEETYTRLLTDLSRLIRLNLNNTYQDRVTLASELEIIHLYVQFEKHRFIRHPLDFAVQYDSQRAAETIKIPSMMLQPFVENAIWHGVLPKQGGKVLLAVKDAPDGYISIAVQDDGGGCDPLRLTERSGVAGVRGIGLIQERIQAYNSLHEKPIQLAFANQPQGFVVQLLFPL